MLVGHRQPTGPVPIPEAGSVDGVDLPHLVGRLGPPWVLRRRASWRTPGQSRAAEAALQAAHAGDTRLGPVLSQYHPDQAATPTRVPTFQPAGAAVHPEVGKRGGLPATAVIRPQTRLTSIAEAAPDPANRVVGEAQVEGDTSEILTLLMARDNGLTNRDRNRAWHDTLREWRRHDDGPRTCPRITHVDPPRQNFVTPPGGSTLRRVTYCVPLH